MCVRVGSLGKNPRFASLLSARDQSCRPPRLLAGAVAVAVLTGPTILAVASAVAVLSGSKVDTVVVAVADAVVVADADAVAVAVLAGSTIVIVVAEGVAVERFWRALPDRGRQPETGKVLSPHYRKCCLRTTLWQHELRKCSFETTLVLSRDYTSLGLRVQCRYLLLGLGETATAPHSTAKATSRFQTFKPDGELRSSQ